MPFLNLKYALLAHLLVCASVISSCKSLHKNDRESKVTAASKGYAAKLEQIVDRIGKEDRAALEREMLTLISLLYNQGILESTIATLVDTFASGASPVEKSETTERLVETIGAELYLRGLSKEGDSVVTPGWDSITAHLDATIPDARFQPRKFGAPSWFTEEAFREYIEDRSNNKFTDTEEAALLINGPASFANRGELINNAKNIFILPLGPSMTTVQG